MWYTTVGIVVPDWQLGTNLAGLLWRPMDRSAVGDEVEVMKRREKIVRQIVHARDEGL